MVDFVVFVVCFFYNAKHPVDNISWNKKDPVQQKCSTC